MLERHSSLAPVQPVATDDISITEDSAFVLTQVSGFGQAFEKDLGGVVGKLPTNIGVAQSNGATTILRIAPLQFWCIAAAPLPELPATCLVTPLSSGRCRIVLDGKKSRQVLARCCAVDFDINTFKTGNFAMTGIHHTPVLIHCTTESQFHIYAMRTFALAVWEWLADAARGLDHARHS